MAILRGGNEGDEFELVCRADEKATRAIIERIKRVKENSVSNNRILNVMRTEVYLRQAHDALTCFALAKAMKLLAEIGD